MREQTVDVAVIGVGTAGLNARRAAEKAGAQAVAIDPGPLGTLCARVGCMPSKLLIAAGEAAHAVREAKRFGVHAGEPRVVPGEVMGRVRRERDRFVEYQLKEVRRLAANGLLIDGRARFVATNELAVGDDLRVKARKAVVVATGSVVKVPPLLAKLESPRVIDSDQVFELEAIPERLLVVGAGPIGVELGQALARLGARVTVICADGKVAGIRDPAVLAAAKSGLAREMTLHTRSKLEAAEARVDGVWVRFRGEDGEVSEGTWPMVLAATGREPRLKGLELERAGVELDDKGRPRELDATTLQCGEAPVFLAGDATGLHPLLHEAIDDGQIAGRNAASFPTVLPGERRTPLGIVFTDPQVAFVGRRFNSLDLATCSIGQVDFGDQGRARVMGKNHGLLRVYGSDATGALLGAELAGPAGEHLAHLLAWAIQSSLTVEQALRLPFYHPVVEEGLRTALLDLRSQMSAKTGAGKAAAGAPGGG
ncbi:dihydrolipoyl dehydrogenase [Nannocystis bainbridge]|uniref:Dihydrolipoyl dehydrogenase n=1 Tax=Nannocystis bainbridge TaxID=2995303 RepID=A0ABT5E843_9BACT|nr:dihydrolipoyl dehydrogenase [Nannocystis bainbridge]MDC0722032.1 dihydrolipoyl dehydrogenase [Nannocystis bainbridge]